MLPTPDSIDAHTTISEEDEDYNDDVVIHEPPISITNVRDGRDGASKAGSNIITPRPRRVDSLGAQKSPEGVVMGAQTAQISIARTVSLNRGKRPVQRAIPVNKQPMRPRVVNVGSRKSTLGMIERGDGQSQA